MPRSSFPTSIFGTSPPAAPGALAFGVTSLVQGWYSGTIPNNGIELRGLENANDNIIGFRSTRFENSSFWPFLEVTWAQGTLSPTSSDTLSGFPRSSLRIDMAGQEKVTWLVTNNTNGNLQGVVEVTQTGGLVINDPATAFTIPPSTSRSITYSDVANFVRLNFTAAGTGSYVVSAVTRDE